MFDFGLQNNGELSDTKMKKKKTKKSTGGSISRLFSRGKQRKSIMSPVVCGGLLPCSHYNLPLFPFLKFSVEHQMKSAMLFNTTVDAVDPVNSRPCLKAVPNHEIFMML